MNEQLKYDLIEKFVRGQMTEDEKLSFLFRIQNEQELKNDLDEYILIANASIYFGEIELKNNFIQIEKRKSLIKMIIKYLIYVIGASLISFLLLKILNPPKVQNVLYANYFEPYRNPTLIRGNKEGSQLYMDGAIFYANKDYSKSANTFYKLCIKENSEESCFYAAISYSYLGKLNEHRINECYSKLSKGSPYNRVAKWYIGLAYLNHNKRDAALDLFKELVVTGGYKSKESKEIIDKIIVKN